MSGGLPSGTPAGLLLVDKPSGITSHDVVDVARRALGERRIGHGGTLDPIATGLLPLAVGEATRLLRFLPAVPKVYRARVLLGVETDTGDVSGAVERTSDVRPGRDHATRAVAALVGEQEQVPPAYSAKRVGGQRLYRAARAGRPIAAPPARVEIFAASLLDFEISGLDSGGSDPGWLELEVHCSPGTYVRSLVVDLGRSLGTCATVASLRRLRSGPFTVDAAVDLDRLREPGRAAAAVIPIDALPLALPALVLAPAEVDAFRAGRRVKAPSGSQGLVAARSQDGGLVGVGESCAEGGGARHLQPRVVLPPATIGCSG